jgi:hypothetical protein
MLNLSLRGPLILPMSRLLHVTTLIWFLAILGRAEEGERAATITDSTPRALASAAIEALRDDEHRQRVSLHWPDDASVVMPKTLEVVLLRGYMARMILWCSWQDGQFQARLLEFRHANWHDPSPEPLRLLPVTIDPERFALTWMACRQIMGLRMEEQRTEEDELFRSGSYSGGSTGAFYHLLTWREPAGEAWHSVPVYRFTRIRDGIIDENDLKMQAFSRLLWELVPEALTTSEKKPADAPPPSAEEIDAWLRLGASLLPSCHGAAEERNWLLAEDLSTLFGCMGGEDEAQDLKQLIDSLPPSQEPPPGQATSQTYRQDVVRDEANRALIRIALRLHWDESLASQEIHAQPGLRFSDNAQERWLRERFHAVDPQAYREMLLDDIHATDPRLACMSLKELRQRYPGEERQIIAALLNHKDADVRLSAALTIIGKEPKNYGWHQSDALADLADCDALGARAMETITQLAADPSVPIPPGTYWYGPSARSLAVGILKASPEPWGWDEARCRQQLERLDETDGRMIHQLATMLGLPIFGLSGQAPTVSFEERPELMALWRRCLVAPPTRGTLIAIEQLCGLEDDASLPRMRELLGILRAGCSPHPVGVEMPGVRFPWISDYDLDRIEKELGLNLPVSQP